MDEQKNNLGDRALKSLQKEFIVVGKTSIKGWHAWLVLGIIAGITAGVLLVANRSGEFDFGFAKSELIRVTKPNDGEICRQGEDCKITWSSRKFPIGATLYIKLIDDTNNNLRDIAKDLNPKLGVYRWAMPADILSGEFYKILIRCSESNSQGYNACFDESDLRFSILGVSPIITSLAPSGVARPPVVSGSDYKIKYKIDSAPVILSLERGVDVRGVLKKDGKILGDIVSGGGLNANGTGWIDWEKTKYMNTTRTEILVAEPGTDYTIVLNIFKDDLYAFPRVGILLTSYEGKPFRIFSAP